MAKTVRLICVGVLPLLAGFLLNWILPVFPIHGFVAVMVSVLLLIGWGYLACKLSDPDRSLPMQSFFMCAFGLVMLLLVLYQELVLKAYWGNTFGLATQMFFLPWLTLASSVISPFVSRVWPMYVLIWVGLFAASCAGCSLKRQK